MRLHVPSVHQIKILNHVKPVVANLKTIASPSKPLYPWRNNALLRRSFTSTITSMLTEKTPPSLRRKKITFKRSEEQQMTQYYAEEVADALRNHDSFKMDRVCKEVIRTGHFNKEILNGIFNFYVQQQNIEGILKFADAFHVSTQPLHTTWYNRALARLPTKEAKERFLQEMKKRDVEVAPLQKILHDKTTTPVDFETVIQNYKENQNMENTIALAQCVSEQLTRAEPNRDNRILEQLQSANIIIPSEVCFILLRHSAFNGRSQFAHDICTYMKDNNIQFKTNQVFSLMVLLDPYTPSLRTLVNSFMSLLNIHTEQERCLKELYYMYVYRKRIPAAELQDRLELIASRHQPTVRTSLFQRIFLLSQKGNPFDMVIANYQELLNNTTSPYERAKLDLILLELCPYYQAVNEAVAITARLKDFRTLQALAIQPLFHTSLAANDMLTFQRCFTMYHAVFPSRVEKAAKVITAKYGYPDALKWCIQLLEQKGKIMEPFRKYRLLLESAIAAKNEELVKSLWSEYSAIQTDPRALAHVILFFRNSVSMAEKMAENLDHPWIHRALIEVYIQHRMYNEIHRVWAKLENPSYSVWVWFLRRLGSRKMIRQYLEQAMKAYPAHEIPLQKVAIASLFKKSQFDDGFELLEKLLASLEPSQAYVDPAIIACFHSRLVDDAHLQRLVQLCEEYPHTESSAALKNLLMSINKVQV